MKSKKKQVLKCEKCKQAVDALLCRQIEEIWRCEKCHENKYGLKEIPGHWEVKEKNESKTCKFIS